MKDLRVCIISKTLSFVDKMVEDRCSFVCVKYVCLCNIGIQCKTCLTFDLLNFSI